MSETRCKCDKNLESNSEDEVSTTCVYNDPVFLRHGWEDNSNVEEVECENTRELTKNVYEDPIFLKVGWD